MSGYFTLVQPHNFHSPQGAQRTLRADHHTVGNSREHEHNVQHDGYHPPGKTSPFRPCQRPRSDHRREGGGEIQRAPAHCCCYGWGVKHQRGILSECAIHECLSLQYIGNINPTILYATWKYLLCSRIFNARHILGGVAMVGSRCRGKLKKRCTKSQKKRTPTGSIFCMTRTGRCFRKRLPPHFRLLVTARAPKPISAVAAVAAPIATVGEILLLEKDRREGGRWGRGRRGGEVEHKYDVPTKMNARYMCRERVGP